jgi:polo-like kinase 1
MEQITATHNSLANLDNQIVLEMQSNHTVIKYLKGKFLGKVRLWLVLSQGWFAKCYELTNLETNQLYAAKIIAKSTLTKPKAKQKVIA